MVDPLEAKRLAAKQMEKIKAKERFKVSRHVHYLIFLILGGTLMHCLKLPKSLVVVKNSFSAVCLQSC